MMEVNAGFWRLKAQGQLPTLRRALAEHHARHYEKLGDPGCRADAPVRTSAPHPEAAEGRFPASGHLLT